MNRKRLDVVLVHEPVVNRRGETIGSAITNLDLHDIARACRTFGVQTYWIVTPHSSQQELAREIIGHWLEGHGSVANPDRGDALAGIRIRSTLGEVIDELSQQCGCPPLVVATSAGGHQESIGYGQLRNRLLIGGEEPVLLVFGTAWGLAPAVFDTVDRVLPPIRGEGSYNHLSVRSAVSIILDRLLGTREEE